MWKSKARFIQLMAQLLPALQKEGRQAISEPQFDELKDLMEQIEAAKFDRKKINQQLAAPALRQSKAVSQS